jgi:hypothetical protein
MANFRAELLDQPVVEAAATVALAYRDLPDGTIVEHMDTLESLGIVRTYPVVPYLIIRWRPCPARVSACCARCSMRCGVIRPHSTTVLRHSTARARDSRRGSEAPS